MPQPFPPDPMFLCQIPVPLFSRERHALVGNTLKALPRGARLPPALTSPSRACGAARAASNGGGRGGTRVRHVWVFAKGVEDCWCYAGRRGRAHGEMFREIMRTLILTLFRMASTGIALELGRHEGITEKTLTSFCENWFRLLKDS